MIGVPVELPLADIQVLIEDAIPRKFNQKIPLGNHGPATGMVATLDLTRGQLSLQPARDRLVFSFPLTGRIPVHTQWMLGNKHFHVGGGIGKQDVVKDVRAVVSGWVQVGVDRRWAFNHQSGVTIQVNHAEVKLFGIVPLSVRGLLQEHGNRELPKVLSEVLEKVNPRFRIRERAADGWNALFIRQPIHDHPRAVVTFEPLGVQISPLRFDSDRVIRTTVAIAGRAVTYIATAPPAVTHSALPELDVPSAPADHFRVILPVELRTSGLVPDLRKSLANHTFSAEGGVVVTLRDIDLWNVDSIA